MRGAPTPAEERLWALLRGGRCGGLKFRRQVPIGDYVADFACFYPRLIVEADGGVHDEAHDAARDAWLRGEMFQVLRFRNEAILADPQGVAEAVRRAAGRA